MLAEFTEIYRDLPKFIEIYRGWLLEARRRISVNEKFDTIFHAGPKYIALQDQIAQLKSTQLLRLTSTDTGLCAVKFLTFSFRTTFFSFGFLSRRKNGC